MAPRHCTACLDDRRCWVCLGTGRLDNRTGPRSACHRCQASGACPQCRPAVVNDAARHAAAGTSRGARRRRLWRAPVCG